MVNKDALKEVRETVMNLINQGKNITNFKITFEQKEYPGDDESYIYLVPTGKVELKIVLE